MQICPKPISKKKRKDGHLQKNEVRKYEKASSRKVVRFIEP